MPLIVFILFLNQTHTQTHGVMDTVIIVEISLSTNRRKKTQPKKGKGSPNLPYQNWVAYAPLTIDRRIMAGSTSGRCVVFSAVRRDESLDEAQPVEARREPVAASAAMLLPRR